MNDTVPETPVKWPTAVLIDTLSLYKAYHPRKVDYAEALRFLGTGFEICYITAHANYFDNIFADYLTNLRVQVKTRKVGHQYDLIREALDLMMYYKNIIVFSEEDYVEYLRQEAVKKGSWVVQFGQGRDIDLPETIFRKSKT